MISDPAFSQQHFQNFQQPTSQAIQNAPQSSMNNWANDFSQLHISPQPLTAQKNYQTNDEWQTQFMHQNQQLKQSHNNQIYNPQISRFSGFQHTLNPMTTMEPLATANTVSKEAESKLFEQAFENVEKELETFRSKETPQPQESRENYNNDASMDTQIPETLQNETEQQVPQQLDENVELSKIAKHIVTNIDRSNNKLKNSNFMMLMEQLSNRMVKLEGEKFIDQYTGSDIREQFIENSDQKALLEEQEMEEQQSKIQQSQSASIQQPANPELNQANHIYQTISESAPSSSNVLDLERDKKLEDPLEKLAQLGAEDLGTLSPFEMAQKVAPEIVNRNNWEENFDDLVM